jgi:hypothetical protein
MTLFNYKRFKYTLTSLHRPLLLCELQADTLHSHIITFISTIILFLRLSAFENTALEVKELKNMHNEEL